MTPSLINHKSLLLHRLVVEKLREDPKLLEGVRRTLLHWRNIVPQNMVPQNMVPQDAQGYIVKWEQVVAEGLSSVERVLLDESDYGVDMRQCSPFGTVLTHKERWQFHKEWGESANGKKAS